MTPLRQRMSEDLQLRGLAERTPAMEVRAVRHLAAHDPQSPDRLTEAARRDDVLSRKHDPHAARAASPIALCGMPCFSAPPVTRAWPPLPCVRPPQEPTRPVSLRPPAGHTLLPCVRWPRSRTCLRPISACGFRLQAGPHLQGPDRDRARMGGHVRDGTGAQARYVPLPPPIRTMRRASGTTHRTPVWRLPAPRRRGVGMATASTPRPRHRGQEALRAARRASGLHQRASGPPLRHAWATQRPVFSAKYPPAHDRERAWKSSPGAGLRVGEGVKSAH
jgi:integrase/recombinase XerD